jgi:hypothetical protein
MSEKTTIVVVICLAVVACMTLAVIGFGDLADTAGAWTLLGGCVGAIGGVLAPSATTGP